MSSNSTTGREDTATTLIPVVDQKPWKGHSLETGHASELSTQFGTQRLKQWPRGLKELHHHAQNLLAEVFEHLRKPKSLGLAEDFR
eukprot:CAMPEP_0184289384 /NCGR_PEP_ID=MMETSP1049-20130417/1841_1 /TAXON_ID=77928 /ORGANISM="Proteomonas sulcata, Strain CCMP704" /LENGTH=85 /DNA_ID=CAMNT_0026596171 /DNA_START=847 /DNA_END=1104 /DNA_ORIENTATION=-